MSREPLKLCPGCRQGISLYDLLYDNEIRPQGIQADPHDPAECYFQFYHLKNDCRATFLIHSRSLRDVSDLLVEGHSPSEITACPGYCAEVQELSACSEPCTLRPYRQFLLSLWWSRSGPTSAPEHPDHQCVRQTQHTEAELV